MIDVKLAANGQGLLLYISRLENDLIARYQEIDNWMFILISTRYMSEILLTALSSYRPVYQRIVCMHCVALEIHC